MKFTTDALLAFRDNEGNPPIVRNLAACALSQRAKLAEYEKTPPKQYAIDRIEQRERSLAAEIKKLKARIAELESMGV